MKEFIFKVVDSFFKVVNLCVRTFVTGSANIFNSIAKVVVKLLVSYEIPYLYASSGVVSRGRVGHFFTRFDTVLDKQKFCFCSAR